MTQITRATKVALAAAVLTLTASAAQAASERTAVFKAVVDCRAIADSNARLACYDAAAARLDEAEAKGDVVVLDRAQTRQARREAFGFTMPSLNVFNRGEPEEQLDRVSFKVVRAWQAGPNAQWVMELDSGAVWRQIDTDTLYRKPKAGSTVEIRSAALGGYMANIDGATAIRVKRDR